MADDSSFRVKNTLVVNNAFVANATVVNAAAVNATSVNTATANATTSIVVGGNVSINTSTYAIGNSSVYTNTVAGQITISGTTINSTFYQATAFNANNLGGNPSSFFTNATNLSTGTIPTGRLSGTYAITANNATNLGGQPDTFYTNATNLSTGTVPVARLSGTYAITANNASNLGGVAAASYQLNSTLAANVAQLTANNSTNLNGQAASFYTDIPSRLGYTPANRNGDTGLTGDFSTSGGSIQVGRGEAGEKQLRFHNSSRLVYLFLQNTTGLFGLFDLSGNFTRWSSDTSGNFTAAGNITAYSDVRLKANIHTIENALDTVNKLRGVTYDRATDGTKQIGVIAQEVKEVLPEVVLEDEQGVLSVAYGNIVGLLIEAVKELSAKVEELENKVK